MVASLTAEQIIELDNLPGFPESGELAFGELIQGLIGGSFDFKESCRATTTANIALTGEQTLDTIALVAGNRALVKDQAAPAENGIYVVSAGAWPRADDADTDEEITSGLLTTVEEGAVNGGTPFVLTTPNPIDLDVTALMFVALSVTPLNIVEDTTPQLGGTLDCQNEDIDNIKSATFSEVDDGDSGAADTIDWNAGNKHLSTLTAVTTYSFTDPPGECNLTLRLIQGGIGSFTATWPASVLWSGGTPPVLSTGVGDVDLISFYFDGTNYLGGFLLNFS